jgi:hypothetical protein
VHPSTVVPDEDQYKEQPECDRRHDEEIGSHDLARVIGEERSPVAIEKSIRSDQGPSRDL